MTDTNGNIWEGEFVNEELHGTGTRKYANGNVYTGQNGR